MKADDGSTLPLTVFFAGVCLALILVVVSATSLYLERKRLFTLADGAALVGAESFDLADVRATPDGYRPALETRDVAAAVTEYLESVPTAEFDGLAVDRADSSDGRSATVSLSADWHPPVLSVLVPAGIRIDVTAVARSVFD